MPNCVSEYAKQAKNMPNSFRNKKTTGMQQKFFTL